MINALIVEDTPDKSAAIVEALRSSNELAVGDISVVADARAARELLEQSSFDLLVLDLRLPEQPGKSPEVATAQLLLDDLFERDELHMPSKIVGLTAYEDVAEQERGAFTARGVLLVHYDASLDTWQRVLWMLVRQVIARKRAEQTERVPSTADVGVICALEMEFDALLSVPWKWEEISFAGDPTLYQKGTFDSATGPRTVIAALSPRMGMPAAGITAAKLIAAVHPEYLFMTGITAALKGQANLGDVIVADSCWDWGMGKWVVRDGTQTFIPGPHVLTVDPEIMGFITRARRDTQSLYAIRTGFGLHAPAHDLRVITGPVASGSAVIASQEMSDRIRSWHRKLIGIEMEAYGVYAAAADAVAPRPKVCALKGVCDYADEEKSDDWQSYAAYTSARVFQLVAERYLFSSE